MKKCNKCKLIKTNREFYKSKNSKSGLHAYCIECNKKYKSENAVKIRIHRQKKHAENKENNNSRCRVYHATPRGRARDLYKSAMKRAVIGGLEFSIVYEHVFVMLLHGKCQKSGIPFDLTQQKNKKVVRNPFAPSLDRIDNHKGYTPDNIQMVCNLYNAGKGQHTDQEFIEFCKAVVRCNP